MLLWRLKIICDWYFRCDKNAECTDTRESYACTCNSGYEGNGLMCKDVDECNTDVYTCHQNAECSNTEGSYTCQCFQVCK